MKSTIVAIVAAILFTGAAEAAQYIRLPKDARNIELQSLLPGKTAGRATTIRDPFCNPDNDDNNCERTVYPVVDSLILTVQYRSFMSGRYEYNGDSREWTEVVEVQHSYRPTVLGTEKAIWDSQKSTRRYGSANKNLITKLFTVEDKVIEVPAWIVDEEKSISCEYDSESNKVDRNCWPKTEYKKDPTGRTESQRFLVITAKFN